MSAEHTSWVYRHSPAKGPAFQVHHAIADSCNDAYEHEFWMRMATLAVKARVSRATAQRAVGWLMSNGFLELLSEEDRRRAGHPARYRFLFPDCPVIYETRGTSRSQRKGVALSAQGGSRPEREEVATTARPIKTQENPSTKPNENNPPATAFDVADVDAAEVERRFAEHLWLPYPARDGKKLDRGKALVIWRKMSIEDQRAAVRGVRHYADYCASIGRAKDAHRWLRDRCWEEWQTPAEPRSAASRRDGQAEAAQAIIDDIRSEALR